MRNKEKKEDFLSIDNEYLSLVRVLKKFLNILCNVIIFITNIYFLYLKLIKNHYKRIFYTIKTETFNYLEIKKPMTTTSSDINDEEKPRSIRV